MRWAWMSVVKGMSDLCIVTASIVAAYDSDAALIKVRSNHFSLLIFSLFQLQTEMADFVHFIKPDNSAPLW
jgi:hypothetical protein